MHVYLVSFIFNLWLFTATINCDCTSNFIRNSTLKHKLSSNDKLRNCTKKNYAALRTTSGFVLKRRELTDRGGKNALTPQITFRGVQFKLFRDESWGEKSERLRNGPPEILMSASFSRTRASGEMPKHLRPTKMRVFYALLRELLRNIVLDPPFVILPTSTTFSSYLDKLDAEVSRLARETCSVEF